MKTAIYTFAILEAVCIVLLLGLLLLPKEAIQVMSGEYKVVKVER